MTVPDEPFTPDDRHEAAVSDEEAAASELEADLARLSQTESERDEYLDTLRRVQAEFENYCSASRSRPRSSTGRRRASSSICSRCSIRSSSR